jgi:hypothetical protein
MNQTVTVRNMFDTVPVLEQIAAGKSLRQVAEQFGISSPSRITELAASDPTFALQYARAQELRADIHADRIETVAAELLDGSRTDSQAARVAIDALKWTASKLRPKRYGDKLQLDADVRMQVELVDATAVQAVATLITKEDPST